MTQIIVAMNEKGGIGYQNRLPWECKKDPGFIHTFYLTIKRRIRNNCDSDCGI